jgi:hypothetical protein
MLNAMLLSLKEGQKGQQILKAQEKIRKNKNNFLIQF